MSREVASEQGGGPERRLGRIHNSKLLGRRQSCPGRYAADRWVDMLPTTIIETVATFAFIGIFLYLYLWAGAWVVGDAQQRGHSGAIIAPLWYVLGPAAAIVWLCVRPARKLIDRSTDDFDSPDDALAAATRLDTLGEWDAAIDMFRMAAKRWPDHASYAERCISDIETKQQRL